MNTYLISGAVVLGLVTSLLGFGLHTSNTETVDEALGALRVTTIPQGGTGTSTAPLLNYILIGDGSGQYILDDIANYASVGGGGGGGMTVYFQNGGATLNVATTTVNFTPNSFSVTESPADTLTIRIATTTLGLLTTNVGEGSNLYYTDARVSTYMSASSTYTNLQSFYTTPSTRITAGTGIDWSGNTLNGVYTAGDALTLNGEDFDFDGGATPGGALGGTWASPTVDNDGHSHTGATLSGIDISDDTNLTVTATGLSLSADAIALTASYFIPTTTRAATWDLAHSWGNHATQGYLTGITGQSIEDLSDVTSFTQAGQDLFYYNGSAWDRLAKGSNGEVLQTNSSGNLDWVATSTLGLGGAGGGTVTSVDMTVPTGLTVSGNPVTTSGTLAVALGAGYNIPLTASTTNWNTAYNWGNHASQGYITDGNTGWDNTYGLITATNATASITTATTTNLAIPTSLSLFGGEKATTANALCIQLTGSADLCDGSDASGAGGGSISTSTALAITQIIYATGVNTIGSEAAFTYNSGNNTLTADQLASAVVRIDTSGVSLDSDNDGEFIITGAGDGSDEDLRLNLDDTANTGVYTSSTGLNILTYPSIGLSVGASSTIALLSATNGTTTNLVVPTSINLFGGGAKTTANDLCIQLTGSAALCDGTDAAGAGGIGTSSIPVAGNLAYWTSASALSDVATGTLSESVAGLELSASRGLIGGSAALSLSSGYLIPTTTVMGEWNTAYSWGNHATAGYDQVTTAGDGLTRTANDFDCDTASGSVFGCLTSTDWNTFNGKESVLTFSGGLTRTTNNIAPTSGYNIPLTASTTAWNNFATTPSGVITAGDGLTWSGNTMNFDGGNAPAGALGGTWASPTVDDDGHSHTGATLSGIDISSDTNLSADGTEIILTGDALSLGTALTFTTGTSTTSFFSGLGTFTNMVVNTLATFLNVVVTGLLDVGGGVLEIPNGTNPTANDVGELAHDTTDNQLILDDFVIGKATERIWGVTVASTSPYFINATNMAIPTQLDGYTMTAIRCHVVSGTSKAIIITDGTNATESITCGTTVTSDDGSITNAAVTAGELMYIDFGSTSGAVDTVSVSVFGTWTRE